MAEEKVVPLTAEAPTYEEQAARISNMEESLNNLQAKLAASEETVRELREWASQLKAMIEAEGNPKSNSRPTQWRQGGVLAEIYAGLAQMAANPPNGMSALSEVEKLRVFLMRIHEACMAVSASGEETEWFAAIDTISSLVDDAFDGALSRAALGERSTSEGEGS